MLKGKCNLIYLASEHSQEKKQASVMRVVKPRVDRRWKLGLS